MTDWAPDCGYLGMSCVDALELQMNGGGKAAIDAKPRMTREQARQALAEADDRIDVRREFLAVGADRGSQSIEMPGEMDGAEIGMYVKEDLRFRRTHSAQTDLYERVARAVAKRFLTYLDKHPEHADNPVWHAQFLKMPEPLLDSCVQLRDLDPTGFQVGWAANFVKYILKAMPCPNPAVLKAKDELKKESLDEAAARVTEILRAGRK